MLRPTIAVLAVLCAGAIVTAVLVIGPASPPTSAVTDRTATVAKGVVQSTVSGSGNLEPARQLDLDFGTSGTVTKISVREGEKVTSGQVLARVDDADARVGLDKAQAALESAEADLDAAESGQTASSSGASNTSAAATIDDTRVSYLTVADEAPTETTATTTTPSETTPTTTTPPTTATTTTPNTPQGATTKTASGKTTQGTKATRGATSARPSGSASGGFGTSSGGSSQTAAQKAAAIATAQANVDQAKLDVEDAEQALEDTVLRAPTAGTVTSLTGAVGDDVSAGSSSAADQSSSGLSSSAGATVGGGTTGDSTSSSFITLSKLDRMQLTVSFTESDIGQVKVGQSATVSLSALSDVQLSGRVTQVAQVGTSSSGVVSYPVTIVLDQSARGVKAGMTASAEVIVKQASGLTLPSQAVTGRGTTGVVQVKQDGETVNKRVGIGLQGDSSTLITSGLQAGDEVVIQSTPAITGGGSAGQQDSGTLSRSGLGGSGGFPAGGGGFPGGGGFSPPSGGAFGGRGG
jgi:multidrug efflux pump subunit AcrA (membrane-fusion protein)